MHSNSPISLETTWAIARTIAIVRSIQRLPAVATLDWCDRAAECFSNLAPGCTACVLIAAMEGPSTIRRIDAAGVARSNHADHSEPTSTTQELRCGFESLTTLGVSMIDGTMTIGQAYGGRLTRTIGPMWKTSPHGQVWAPANVSEVLVAVAPLNPTAPTLAAIALVGLDATDPGASEAGVAVVLECTIAMASIASQAIGPSGGKGQWISAREQEVLEFLVRGMSVREIAEELGRSPHTVHDHVKSLHKKLNANSRGELIARTLGRTGLGADHT